MLPAIFVHVSASPQMICIVSVAFFISFLTHHFIILQNGGCFKIAPKDSIQRCIYINRIVADPLTENALLTHAAFFHYPSAGRISKIMLGFQPVQGKRGKRGFDNCAE